MWGNAVWEGGPCENPLRLSMCDGPMETVEHMGLNIWCTLDWINVFCHKSAEIIFELGGFKFI